MAGSSWGAARYLGDWNCARENSSNVSVPSWLVSSWSNTRRAGLSAPAAVAAAGRSAGIALPDVLLDVLPVEDAGVAPVDVPVTDVPAFVVPVVPVVLRVPGTVLGAAPTPFDRSDGCAPGVAPTPFDRSDGCAAAALPVSPPVPPVSAAMDAPAKPSVAAIAPHNNVRLYTELIVNLLWESPADG